MWWVWLLHKGDSGDGSDLVSSLCKYDFRKGDLFVISWARVRRVRLRSFSSELLMCLQHFIIASCGKMPRDKRCMYMAHVCFYVCCSDCGGGYVGMFAV